MKSSRLVKPWLILPPKVLAALLLLLAFLALGVGVYTGFFATKGFASATAVIERIEEMHRRSAHKRQLMPMC